MKKWEEIYNYLYKKIFAFQEGMDKYLPSKNSLRTKFKVSMQPIGKAYQQLIADKLVEAQHGKGFKINTQENNVLFSFTNLYPNARNEYQYCGKVLVDENIRAKTRFYYEDFVHEIRVNRYIDDKLFVYQISYISDFLLNKPLDINYIQSNGLMKFFANYLKTSAKFSLKKVLTTNRIELEYQELTQFKTDLLVLDKGMLFGGNQQLIEYRESYYNFDEFEWSFIEYYR